MAVRMAAHTGSVAGVQKTQPTARTRNSPTRSHSTRDEDGDDDDEYDTEEHKETALGAPVRANAMAWTDGMDLSEVSGTVAAGLGPLLEALKLRLKEEDALEVELGEKGDERVAGGGMARDAAATKVQAVQRGKHARKKR